MANNKPTIQAIIADPNPVKINQSFVISVTVVDSEMVVTFYSGEIYSGEAE